ncbi:MAG: flagellar motor protein [Syntrophomonadaceae bacterium]|jgi:chemotaxis protein MotA|nr:flagellar motor protein [Syntrophomonadaceae bacterium]
MDITSIVGLILGFGLLLLGFLEEGGSLSMLVVPSAFIIVFGGTIGATVVSFTLADLKKTPAILKSVFTDKKIDYANVLESLVAIADSARREGLLSLEAKINDIENPFFARGLNLVIDGTDPELTRSMLEMEIQAYEDEQKIGTEIFMTAGGFGPTMGIIGTVMGMVQVLSNLSSPEELSGAIAVAFLATLYGISSANLLWIPFGNKIKVKTKREILLMEMILEGILSVQAGENPRVIREKLMTFLSADIKKALTSKAEEN